MPEQLDREQMTQALVWRQHARPRLELADDVLTDAIAGMPISLERVQARAAQEKVREALRTCASNQRVAEHRLADEQEATG